EPVIAGPEEGDVAHVQCLDRYAAKHCRAAREQVGYFLVVNALRQGMDAHVGTAGQEGAAASDNLHCLAQMVKGAVADQDDVRLVQLFQCHGAGWHTMGLAAAKEWVDHEAHS